MDAPKFPRLSDLETVKRNVKTQADAKPDRSIVAPISSELSEAERLNRTRHHDTKEAPK